ncbi:hypothetical protein FEM48_Zijuj04G0109600 [Ziziphus jujuba var. spinosa]|uniref:Kinesin light chain 3 n=1 Tax=Ziziphus jujuba var. spinosa TaxID=714518 RepID=A0A978VJH4_ZIZJJ|nr:hypothetical protein FEM48_Zijuj04G0109600 [Ziziphus jujuba var. spinosa]
MPLRQAVRSLMRKRIRIPSQIFSSSDRTTSIASPISFFDGMGFSYGYGPKGGYTRDPRLWLFLSGNAAMLLGINTNPVLAKEASLEERSENDAEVADIVGLRKIEDDSVKSNIHTAKWRVFTDNGRESFMQAGIYRLYALENWRKLKGSSFLHYKKLKKVLGRRIHMLHLHATTWLLFQAELYRVNKAFDKAEPLYLKAIDILEETFGPEDIRVGSAFHNLGQFYLVQRKLEEAHTCYERALKIKGRVLGLNHIDYADAMYHLGTVLYLQGKEKDAEALIQDSIRILEESGHEESIMCIRRLRYLAQVIYLRSNRPGEAENVQRKILHVMELIKGWNSLDTIIAAEGLALTLQSNGNLNEALELLERCLDARKVLLPGDHVQIAANMLHIARLAMHNSSKLRKVDTSKAITELNKAKDLLTDSIRIASLLLNKAMKENRKVLNNGASGETKKHLRTALIILLQSLDALGLLEIEKQELQELKDEHSPVEAENALLRCISAYREFGTESSISDTHEVKVEYLSCLKHFSSLISDNHTQRKHQSQGIDFEDLKGEIKRLEVEISHRRQRN